MLEGRVQQVSDDLWECQADARGDQQADRSDDEPTGVLPDAWDESPEDSR